MVIDPGLSNSAPAGQSPPPARGACAVIAESRSGADALMAIATPRVDKGLVCGIDEYPIGECAIAIDTTSISPDGDEDILTVPTPAVSETAIAAAPVPEKGSPVPLIAVGLIIALGLVGAWLLQRRRAS